MISSSAFVRKQGNQLSVCLYSSSTNNKLICLKNGTDNWEENKNILNTTNFPRATYSSNLPLELSLLLMLYVRYLSVDIYHVIKKYSTTLMANICIMMIGKK